eukprot:CAMPEP_0185029844 /NCGR_PEP_ID=MMETSP1103-20130426/16424_1 /TAXON_ID=36769 /ORGANISM="Paraphysomonas bandaiensis, Strain Caron Lab Isolate" /LENGTH=215 /DNA_ID=CAMNT_0027564745 /DNA_START=102 /DNA_END=745 /DNA_ORIENTATION=+
MNVDKGATDNNTESKRSELPWWMPPHYRALMKPNKQYSQPNGPTTTASSDDRVTEKRNRYNNPSIIFYAFTAFFLVDVAIWLGIKRFYKRPSKAWQDMGQQGNRHQGDSSQHRQNAESFHKNWQSAYANYESSQSYQRSSSYQRNESTYRSSYSGIPSHIERHMRALDIQGSSLPTVNEVKKAFRQISMHNHPDRLDSSISPSERQRRIRKFINA